MAGDKCDLLITNAVVYDGTGAAPRKGDVAVRADRIVAVGRLDGWYAAETLDANGLALAPGFIDAHTHDDRAVLSTPEMSAKVSQGVTTVIGGNCGISIAPGIGREPPPPLNLLGNREWFRFDRVADYFEAVEASPPALNIALLVGHSTLRAATMDKLDRPATPAEIERMGELLDEAMKANRDGQAADFDVYPYTASSTVLLAHFVERAEKVLITWSTPHPEVAGEELTGIAERWKCSIDDAVVKLQPAGAIYFQMDEADLRRVLRHPGSMVGSDGIPHDEHPHPRLWGTFPRVLGHYARDEGLFSMEEAVYKMTGLTARVFGLKDRGNIAPGYFADLVLFNQDEVIDRADFLAPTTPSAGIERVMVNGQTVWQDGAPSGKRPGGVLRRE